MIGNPFATEFTLTGYVPVARTQATHGGIRQRCLEQVATPEDLSDVEWAEKSAALPGNGIPLKKQPE